MLSASGGLRPPSDTLTRGSAPGPRWARWGLRPKTPVIDSRFALAISPLPLLWRSLRLCALDETNETYRWTDGSENRPTASWSQPLLPYYNTFNLPRVYVAIATVHLHATQNENGSFYNALIHRKYCKIHRQCSVSFL